MGIVMSTLLDLKYSRRPPQAADRFVGEARLSCRDLQPAALSAAGASSREVAAEAVRPLSQTFPQVLPGTACAGDCRPRRQCFSARHQLRPCWGWGRVRRCWFISRSPAADFPFFGWLLLGSRGLHVYLPNQKEGETPLYELADVLAVWADEIPQGEWDPR